MNEGMNLESFDLFQSVLLAFVWRATPVTWFAFVIVRSNPIENGIGHSPNKTLDPQSAPT